MEGVIATRRSILARIGLIVGAAACFAWPSTVVPAQEPPLVFRAAADLVLVQAVVFESGGGPVVDLGADDFTILENGEERPVSIFIGPESGPVEIALVVDSSGSMTRWPTREAIHAFLDSLHPGSCVLFLPFNEEVHVGVWGQPNDEGLRESVSDLQLGGDEAIYDALLAAFKALRVRAAAVGARAAEASGAGFDALARFRAPGRIADPAPLITEGDCTAQRDPWGAPRPAERVRRAVVVVTDGQDTKSRASPDDVLVAGWGSGLPLFAFAATEQPRSGGADMVGRPVRVGHVRELQRVADYTGGVVFRVEMDRRGNAFWNAFQRLGAALRGHYVLGYIPTMDAAGLMAERREIEVKVKKSGVEVMAPDDLVLGRGASEGAAFDLALRGFESLASGRAEDALQSFETAAALGPRVGLVHYGRGIALSQLERPDDALHALRTAGDLAPWIPDIDARMAEIELGQGAFDSAWEHVLRAHGRGSSVLRLIDRLQELAPRKVDLNALPNNPRIALQLSGENPLLGVEAPAILAAIGNGILESSELTLADGVSGADLVLLMEVRALTQRGSRVSMSGWIVLSREADEMAQFRFDIRDAASAEEVQASVAEVVQRVERAVGSER